MSAIVICVGIYLAIALVDLALAARSDRLLAEIQWRIDHPEEAAAQALERARAEVALLVECGVTEEEAWSLWTDRALAEIEAYFAEPA